VSPLVFLAFIVPFQALIFGAMWWKRRKTEEKAQPPEAPVEESEKEIDQ